MIDRKRISLTSRLQNSQLCRMMILLQLLVNWSNNWAISIHSQRVYESSMKTPELELLCQITNLNANNLLNLQVNIAKKPYSPDQDLGLLAIIFD